MKNNQYNNTLNGGCKAVGGTGVSASAGRQHPVSPFISIREAAKNRLIDIALSSRDLSVVKERVMHLYEKKIITAGDVERLFTAYKLGSY